MKLGDVFASDNIELRDSIDNFIVDNCIRDHLDKIVLPISKEMKEIKKDFNILKKTQFKDNSNI